MHMLNVGRKRGEEERQQRRGSVHKEEIGRGEERREREKDCNKNKDKEILKKILLCNGDCNTAAHYKNCLLYTSRCV